MKLPIFFGAIIGTNELTDGTDVMTGREDLPGRVPIAGSEDMYAGMTSSAVVEVLTSSLVTFMVFPRSPGLILRATFVSPTSGICSKGTHTISGGRRLVRADLGRKDLPVWPLPVGFGSSSAHPRTLTRQDWAWLDLDALVRAICAGVA